MSSRRAALRDPEDPQASGIAMPAAAGSPMGDDASDREADDDGSPTSADREPLRAAPGGIAVGRPLEFWVIAAVCVFVGTLVLPFAIFVRRASVRFGSVLGSGLHFAVGGVAAFIVLLTSADLHPGFTLLPLIATPPGIAMVYFGAQRWASATARRGHADLALALGVSLVLVVAVIAAGMWYMFQALTGSM